jgi:two-component sensor histidine kinase
LIEESAMVRKLLRQQAAIAAFGTFALRQTDLPTILNEAAKVCAQAIDVPYSKICRHRPAKSDLIIEAGWGWPAGVIGSVVPAVASSPQGRAFTSRRPSICNFLRDEGDFILPGFYAKASIISTIDVVIVGAAADSEPYGVLEIDSDRQQDYDQHDIDFLTGFANVLAEAVATSERTNVLRATIDQMRALVEDKDRLLDQRKVLAEELQHRVRNNLQLVYGMLTKELGETSDATAQRAFKAIARRVFTLSQVYDQLLGTEMGSTMDFSSYLTALCRNMTDVQGPANGAITLHCKSEPILLDLDVTTALGIIVAELVTNSFDHAFPTGKGHIDVSLRHDADDDCKAILIIADDGTGFVPVAESKRHGVGLVRRLAEQAGGEAEVESDHGTRWTITFARANSRSCGHPS